jgi:hypothetical protein
MEFENSLHSVSIALQVVYIHLSIRRYHVSLLVNFLQHQAVLHKAAMILTD